jgi:chromosome segregation ATPase
MSTAGSEPIMRGGLFILLLSSLLLSAGCEDRGAQKAKQEAADARAAVARLQLQLAAADDEKSKLTVELKAVKQTRDELQAQADKTGQERDQAIVLARQAKDAITQLSTQADGQAGVVAALEKQVAELKAQVKEQQKTIEELQKGSAVAAKPADVSTEADANQTSPPEPNDRP